MNAFVKRYNREVKQVQCGTHLLTFPINPTSDPASKPGDLSHGAIWEVDQCQYLHSADGQRCTKQAGLYPQFCDEHGVIVYEMKIAPSTIPQGGNGLFSQVDLMEGDFVALYAAEAITPAEYNQRYPDPKTSYYCLQVQKNQAQQKYDLILDGASTQSCLARNINDGRGDPRFRTNASFALIPTKSGYMAPVVLALREITAGEEVFVSYGETLYWDPREPSEAKVAEDMYDD